MQLDCMQGQQWVVGSPLHIPRWGASSAWRTTSSNSGLDIFAETNWSSASKYAFAFAPRATLSCPLMVDVESRHGIVGILTSLLFHESPKMSILHPPRGTAPALCEVSWSALSTVSIRSPPSSQYLDIQRLNTIGLRQQLDTEASGRCFRQSHARFLCRTTRQSDPQVEKAQSTWQRPTGTP